MNILDTELNLSIATMEELSEFLSLNELPSHIENVNITLTSNPEEMDCSCMNRLKLASWDVDDYYNFIYDKFRFYHNDLMYILSWSEADEVLEARLEIL
jgi:hypothetical protein